MVFIFHSVNIFATETGYEALLEYIAEGVVGKKTAVTSTDDAFELGPKGRKWRKKCN